MGDEKEHTAGSHLKHKMGIVYACWKVQIKWQGAERKGGVLLILRSLKGYITNEELLQNGLFDMSKHRKQFVSLQTRSQDEK